MNKKILFLTAGMVMATVSFAQKDKLKEATKELQKAQTEKAKPDEAAAIAAYQKAKEAIDAAVAHPDTKDNAKTWFTKAGIYIGMQEFSALNADLPYREGLAALKKAFELDKKLESDDQTPAMLANSAFYSYNDGIQTYNNARYGEAFERFKAGAELLGPDKDKRFMLMPIIDTIRAQTGMFMGYTAFYDEKYNDAVTILEPLKNSPYLQEESNIYLILSMAYEKLGKKEQSLAVLQEGKKKFPGDKNLANAELNHYINSGNLDQMIAKLEEAIAQEPSNADLYLNLGIIYGGMAYPGQGKPAPANAAELGKKAEDAYTKAASLDPENASVNYQLGAFYYNQAADINGQMAQLGTSKAEQVKYNEMLAQRDALFDKALPALEKSSRLFGAKEKNLVGEEKRLYYDCLKALREMYVILDKTEKASALRAKMEQLNR